MRDLNLSVAARCDSNDLSSYSSATVGGGE